MWAYAVVSDDTVREEQLIEHCAEQLAPFKVPSVVRLCGELPRTSVGKIDKERLRREARTLVEAGSTAGS